MRVDVEHLLADAKGIVAGIFWADEAFVVDVVPVEMVAVIAGVAVGGLPYPILAHDASAVPHSIIEIESANLGKILDSKRDAAERVCKVVFPAVDVDQRRMLHTQWLPHTLAEVVGIPLAGSPLDDRAEDCRRHALVAELSARLAAEFQPSDLPHDVVPIIKPRHSVDHLQVLQGEQDGTDNQCFIFLYTHFVPNLYPNNIQY